MSSSKSKSTPQFVTLQVACDKTKPVEKNAERMTSVTELALCILGLGCGLTLAATGIAFHARGELGFGLPKAFSGLGSTNTLPMSGFLFGSSTESRPDSIFSSEPQDLHSQEPLPLALASPGNSIATVIRHGLSGSKPTRKKGLLSWGSAYAQAAPPERLSKPPDIAPPVTTISPSIASDRSAVQGLAALAPPPALAAVEELQHWFGKEQPSFGLSFGDLRAWCLVKQFEFIIFFGVLTFVGLSLGLKAKLKKGKSSKPALGVAADSALAETPQTPGIHSEDDIMEAFDAFDRKRMGFIDRATVNHMLGHMALPGHLDAAAPFLGSVKKLFYDDFRRLAQQPGPFADIVMERVSRRNKTMEAASKRAHAFDERCKFGLDVDAAQAAISAVSQGPQGLPAPQPCTPAPCNAASAPGGRRSWAELRADLAPKPSTD